MNQNLKDNLKSYVEELQYHNKQIANFLGILERTYNSQNADGSNGSAMDSIIDMKQMPLFEKSKISSLLNEMHNILWKDAQASLKKQREEEAKELAERAPKSPSKKKKTDPATISE